MVHLVLQKLLLDLTILTTYSPRSNFLFLGKVVETAVVRQLEAFLNDASILDSFQSSFHTNNGMETMLVTLTDDFWRHLN